MGEVARSKRWQCVKPHAAQLTGHGMCMQMHMHMYMYMYMYMHMYM